MAKPLEIPFGYGDVVSITGSGPKVVVWLKDATGVIRGLLLDTTDPASPTLAKDEIIIRRKTEGQVRKKKLPPVGQTAAAAAPPPTSASPRPAASAPPRPAAPTASPAAKPAPGSSSR